MYREAYNMFICCGILFNHESPRRALNFVTRKITSTICEIYRREKTELVLGNLDSERDWGFAGDYVKAMWLMLQHDIPDDYIIATGKTHSVREFVKESCKFLGLSIDWRGVGLDEVGYIRDKCSGVDRGLVRVSKKYYRPKDVCYLKGNSQKAHDVLGWTTKVSFKSLVTMMVIHDED